MCGITGFVDLRKQTTISTLQSMTDSLVHRGPDGGAVEFFQKDNFDKLYSDFLAELYRTGKDISVEEEEEGPEGGAKGGAKGEIDKSGFVRGAT